MFEKSDSSAGASPDLIKVALNTLYLCLARAVRHIEAADPQAASEFKGALLEDVKNGNVDMALLEDAVVYDFIVPKIESLLTQPPR
jgi:hypothetical protein